MLVSYVLLLCSVCWCTVLYIENYTDYLHLLNDIRKQENCTVNCCIERNKYEACSQ